MPLKLLFSVPGHTIRGTSVNQGQPMSDTEISVETAVAEGKVD